MWRAMRSKRVHRCLAIAPFALMLGIVLLFWIWNLVGSRAVIATSEAIADAGFAKSYFEYCNPEIPADEDVFEHPAMLDADIRNLAGPYISEMSLPGLARRAPKTQMDLAEPMGVAGWFDPPLPGGGDEVAGDALLRHFSPQIIHLEQVADALNRPRSSWGISPEESRPISDRPDFFSIARLRGAAEFASKIAVFELAVGESKRAAEKVGMILDFEEHLLGSNPTGLTVLIAKIGMANAKMVVWEGIMREAWLDEDLLEFDQRLEKLEPRLAIVEAQKGALAFQRSEMLEALERPRKREQQDLLEGWDDGREAIFRRLRGLVWEYGPRGRWDKANARTAEIIWQEGILDQGRPRTQKCSA